MRAAFGTELVYSSTRLQQALWVPTIECLRTSSAQGPTSEGRSSQVQGSGNSRCPHLPNPGSAFSLSLPGVLCALLLQHLEEKGSLHCDHWGCLPIFPLWGWMRRAPSQLCPGCIAELCEPDETRELQAHLWARRATGGSRREHGMHEEMSSAPPGTRPGCLHQESCRCSRLAYDQWCYAVSRSVGFGIFKPTTQADILLHIPLLPLQSTSFLRYLCFI